MYSVMKESKNLDHRNLFKYLCNNSNQEKDKFHLYDNYGKINKRKDENYIDAMKFRYKIVKQLDGKKKGYKGEDGDAESGKVSKGEQNGKFFEENRNPRDNRNHKGNRDHRDHRDKSYRGGHKNKSYHRDKSYHGDYRDYKSIEKNKIKKIDKNIIKSNRIKKNIKTFDQSPINQNISLKNRLGLSDRKNSHPKLNFSNYKLCK